ncbi:diguanylate cyclase domain-containing protein [Halobacillus mangrovi]|uniref:diguanylate cyclase domain-containing protein n=1 Tax=Halobacillus mangrovi TaxID=402384 RepID=UPI003D991D7C
MSGIDRLMAKSSAIASVLHMTQDSIAIIERKDSGWFYTYMNKSMMNQYGDQTGKEIIHAHSYLLGNQLSLAVEKADKEVTAELQCFSWSNHEAFLHRLEKSKAYLITFKTLLGSENDNGDTPYEALVEKSPDSIFVYDHLDQIVYVNNAALRLLGALKKTDIIGKDIDVIFGDGHQSRGRLISEDKSFSLEERQIRRFDGRLVDVELNSGLIGRGNRELTQITCRNVTERRRQLNELKEMAYYDQLTQVYNRRYFYEQLQREINSTEEVSSSLSVLFIDLDNFKEINDQYGHHIGDEVLVIFTKRVKQMLRLTDTFSRLGGDEFVVLLSNLKSSEVSQRIAERMMESITRPITINGYTLFISVSIGIASYPEHGGSLEMLMTNADHALYEAKKKGRKCVEVYRM